ncbi:MAG: glycosyltransferase family 4 protein [Candidatus Yonathbacteria bacterium]|nr:glycosyltransferase family 4 protein [Candidatus Yonathbacteria bacterium]
MKIAFIAGRDIREQNDTDGATVLIRNLAEFLAIRGHTVNIYTPGQYKGGAYRKKVQRQDKTDTSSLHANIQFTEFFSSSVADIAPTNDPAQYFLNRISISMEEADFFSGQNLHQYDCIYIFHVAHTFGLIAKDLLPINKTILFPMMLGVYYRMFMPVPDEYIERERKALKKLLHVSSPSSAELDLLKNEYGIDDQCLFKIHRGYNNGIFAPYARTRINDNKPVHLVCANVVRPQKGQSFFIALAEYARDHGQSFIIHLVGVNGKTHSDWYNEYANALMREIDARGLKDFFKIHNVMTQEELAAIMRMCDVALYPSIIETFGKSSLESVVSGLPTIVFGDVPAFTEYLTDRLTGMRIQRTVIAAYETVVELIKDTELYSSISNNGIAEASLFTWEHVFSQMLSDQKKRGFDDL